MKGRLFIVSGPSGVGKSSLCAALLERTDKLHLSVSCTTRQPRPGEQDGREYHFLDQQTFERQRDAGMFLEWACVHGNFYGTRQQDVERVLNEGEDVLLEIDWQGAEQVAAKMPQAIRIFILPPSIDELRRRLLARAQDDRKVVEKRVSAAAEEMKHAEQAQYRIVNEDFERSLQKLLTIVQARKHSPVKDR